MLSASTHPPRLPSAFWGLWRRIHAEGLPADESRLEVFYLQGPRLFADLRIPPHRPAIARTLAPAQWGTPERRAFGQQIAFAGAAQKRGQRLIWNRWFNHAPASADDALDEGRVRLHGRRMTEWGVHADYVEEWERVDDGQGRFVALKALPLAGLPAAMLVVGGEQFLFARAAAPGGEKGSGSEFSYGLRRDAAGAWRVEASTQPAREGRARFAPRAWRFAAADGFIDGPFGGNERVRRWRIVDATLAAKHLLTFLDGR